MSNVQQVQEHLQRRFVVVNIHVTWPMPRRPFGVCWPWPKIWRAPWTASNLWPLLARGDLAQGFFDQSTRRERDAGPVRQWQVDAWLHGR